jgi:hypothetical protein
MHGRAARGPACARLGACASGSAARARARAGGCCWPAWRASSPRWPAWALRSARPRPPARRSPRPAPAPPPPAPPAAPPACARCAPRRRPAPRAALPPAAGLPHRRRVLARRERPAPRSTVPEVRDGVGGRRVATHSAACAGLRVLRARRRRRVHCQGRPVPRGGVQRRGLPLAVHAGHHRVRAALPGRLLAGARARAVGRQLRDIPAAGARRTAPCSRGRPAR